MTHPYRPGHEERRRRTQAPERERGSDGQRPRRWAEEVGEGVISTAIAVLIMAFIGAAMWAVFNGVFTEAGAAIEEQVSEIGS